MELRRYKDILALKTRDARYMGFHATNLEVAELTETVWAKMSPVDAATSTVPTVEPDEELDAWNSEINPDTKDLSDAGYIHYFSVNIAQICNLKCTYCAAGGDGTYGSRKTKVDLDITFSQLKWLLEKVPAGGSFDIRFLGGEPLLYPSVVREIADYARLLVAGRDIQLNFRITTNGTLITPKVAQLLADLGAHVTISLDGAREINDQVRPSKNKRSSTAMTLEGLKNLAAVRGQLAGLQVNAVFGTHNMDVIGTYRYLNSIADWDTLNLSYSINEQDDAMTEKYIEQMRLVAGEAFARQGLDGLARIIQFRGPLSRVEAQTRNRSHCAAGKTMIQSDTRGDLYICNWFMTDKAEQVGRGTRMEESRLAPYQSSLIELNNCQTCWNRYLCGGGCMAVNKAKTGDKHLKDINFCRRERSLSAIALEYYFNYLRGQDEEKH